MAHVYENFNLLLANLHDGWTLPLFCIDLHAQLMQTALLLLLVAPLAGLAAPIEKPSSTYHHINAEAVPNNSPPTYYRRWRHHGHLTFRLARVQPCSGRTNKQARSANKNMHPEFVHNRHAIPWVG